MSFNVRLPFDSDGIPVTVTQAPGQGDPSHKDQLYYSWDFALGFGHEVLAIADGTVIDIRETLTDGDNTALPSDLDTLSSADLQSLGSGAIGNIVTVEHQIGNQIFYSTYMHLEYDSVPVVIGQHVDKGQIIGNVGDTGAREGTHLHLQVGATSISYGATPYGSWPSNSDNELPQKIADASNTSANANLVTFEGFPGGIHYLDQVVGPPKPAPAPPQPQPGFWSSFVNAVGAVFKIVFDKIIVPAEGLFTIHRADASVVQQYDAIGDSHVQFSGNTVEINTETLLANQQYYLTIAPTAVMASSGVLFAGVSDNSLSFTATAVPQSSPPPPDPPVFTEGRDIAHIPDGGGPYDALGGDDVLIGSPGPGRVVYGGAGNDLFYASGKGSYLQGGSGDDWFTASVAGGDNFYGDSLTSPLGGNDTVDFSNFSGTVNASLSSGIATANGFQYGITVANIVGGSGDDTLTGIDIDNRLVGNAGNDWIYGYGGNDVLLGGTGNDNIYGGIGADLLYGDDGNDSLNGDDGNDYLDGGAGDDSLSGGAGNDTLAGGLGNDNVFGEDGDDTLVASAGTDWLSGGDGVDTVDFSQAGGALTGGSAQITVTGWGTTRLDSMEIFIGSPYDDNIGLTAQYQEAHLGAGNDFLSAEGVSRVYGDDGNDRVFVNNSTATVYGGTGDDDLRSVGTSNVEFFGDDGNDKLFGGSGTNVLHGGAGNDQLYAAGSSNSLFGDDGDDQIYGDSGNDYLSGGAGNDFIQAAGGDDSVDGGDGADTIDGGDGNNYLDGGAGDDRIAGGSGDDFLYGGDGNDTLVGSAGNDWVRGADGVDTIDFSQVGAGLTGGDAQITVTGLGVTTIDGVEKFIASNYDDNIGLSGQYQEAHLGAGNDRLTAEGVPLVYADGGNDQVFVIDSTATVYGGTGDDDLRSVGASNVEFFGEDGNDKLFGGGGVNILHGGAGNDQLYAVGSNNTVYGDDGDDQLYGDSGGDVLNGGAGADVILAGAGDDIVDGGDDADVIDGQAGNDTLSGGAGDDQLRGGAGIDKLYGGAGNDTLIGEQGADTLAGGTGNDIYNISSVDSVIVEAAGEGTDTAMVYVNGYTIGANVEVAYLGAGVSSVTGNDTGMAITARDGLGATITGGAGNDQLYGADQADTLIGGGGDDYLRGRAGDDTLYGGAGNDTLIGEFGADTLIGGTGNDIYQVSTIDTSIVEAAGEGSDTAIVFVNGYTVGANVETVFLGPGVSSVTGNDTGMAIYARNGVGATINGGAGSDQIHGADQADTLYGGGGDDTIDGGPGNDVLSGGAGNDTLSGGFGQDVFAFSRGDGNDLVHASASDGSDTVSFGSGVGHDQLWFARSGNDLVASVIGEDQTVTVSGWYTSGNYQVGQFNAGDGYSLDGSGVEQLVQAMASLARPGMGQTTLPADVAATLAPVLASSWHNG